MTLGTPDRSSMRPQSTSGLIKRPSNLPKLPLGSTITDPKEMAHRLAAKPHSNHPSKRSSHGVPRSPSPGGFGDHGLDSTLDSTGLDPNETAKRNKLMAILAREREKHEQKKHGMRELQRERALQESRLAQSLEQDALEKMVKHTERRPQTMHSSTRRRNPAEGVVRQPGSDEIIRKLRHLTADIKDLSATVPAEALKALNGSLTGTGRPQSRATNGRPQSEEPHVWQTLYKYEADLQDELQKKAGAEKRLQQLQLRLQLDEQVKERETNKLRLLEEEKFWAEQEFIQLEAMKKKDQEERDRRKARERDNRDAIVKDRLLRKQKKLEEKIRKKKEEKRQVKKYMKEIEEAKVQEAIRKEKGRLEAQRLTEELEKQREIKEVVKEKEKTMDLAKHEEYLYMLEKQDIARKAARDAFLDRQKKLFTIAMDKAPDWRAIAEEDARKAKDAYDKLVAKQDEEMNRRLRKADMENKAFREALEAQKKQREKDALELKKVEEMQAVRLTMVAKEAAAKAAKNELLKKQKTIAHYEELRHQINEVEHKRNAAKNMETRGILTDLETTINKPLLAKADQLHHAKDRLSKLEKLDELHTSLNDVWGRFFKVVSRDGQPTN